MCTQDFKITKADIGRKVRLANGCESTIVDAGTDPKGTEYAQLKGGLTLKPSERMKPSLIDDAQEHLESRGWYYHANGSFPDDEDAEIMGDNQYPVAFID